MRSYSSITGFGYDSDYGETNGLDGFLDRYEAEHGKLECPSGGEYSTYKGQRSPAKGVLYLRCSHPEHAPSEVEDGDWVKY